jgi:hypothetical protein
MGLLSFQNPIGELLAVHSRHLRLSSIQGVWDKHPRSRFGDRPLPIPPTANRDVAQSCRNSTIKAVALPKQKTQQTE